MRDKTMKDVLDIFNGMLYIRDASGTVHIANRYTREVLDFDPRGQRLTEMMECFDENQDRGGCCEKVWKHGDRFFLTSERSVELDGIPGAVAVFGYDITDWTRLEAELHAARDTAESSSAAKTRFLATMSHEIRTPLNAIMGMADIILKTDLDDNQAHYARTIKDSSKLLLKIIKDILDFSKIEAGKMIVEQRQFDLPEIVRFTAATLQAQAMEKGVSLFVNIADDVPDLVRSDPDKIQQILVNLLGNAIKFTDKGFVTLTVLNREDESVGTVSKGDFSPQDGPSSSRVVFQVQDSGIGIPADKLDTIFSSFTQVSEDSSRRFGGTGLGLSICRNLVQLLGGSIFVSSTEGVGSKFTVALTVEKISNGKCGEVPTKEEVSDSSLVPFTDSQEKIAVLLVEDNPMNAEVTKLFLKQMGHSMTLAENGAQALALLEKNKFDLVLMDLELPDMNGNEVTVKIRNGSVGPENREVPIVSMTAHAFVEFRDECIASGATDYLSKPVELETLRDCLERVFFRQCHFANKLLEVDCSETVEHMLPPEKKLIALGGNEDVLHKLYSLFLGDVPEQLKKLEVFVSARDSEEVVDVSHNLKGSAAIIGAGRAKELAAELEKAGRLGKTALFEDMFAAMRQEYLLVVDLVRDYLDRA